MKYFYVFLTSALLLPCQLNAATELAGVGHAHEPLARNDYRKPGADVMVSSAESVALVVGEQRSLSVTLASHVAQGTLSVDLSSDPGVQLGGSQTRWVFDLADGPEFDLPVELYSAVPGRHYLHLFVSVVDADGRTSGRAMAVAVQVGPEQKLTNKAAARDKHPAAGKVAPLPARENVRQNR